MREIKFRGKKKSDGKLVYGDLNQMDEGVFIFNHEIGGDNMNSPDDYEVDPETVGQYTGLKDKNGVKIYEGDKVKIIDESFTGQAYERTSTIIYSNSKGAYHAEGTNCDHLGDFIINIYGKNISEVIGNIHDK